MVTINNGYERQDGGLTTRVWFLGDGIVRIRRSLTGDFYEHSPILLLTAWEDRYDGLLGTERTRVQAPTPLSTLYNVWRKPRPLSAVTG